MFAVAALFLIVAYLHSVTASPCLAFPNGYYSPASGGVYNFIAGAPPTNAKYTYTLKPDFLTCDEVEKLNTYCVSRINRYRSGELKFTGNEADATLGSPKALKEAKENARCQAEISLGDFNLMASSCGGGAHKNAWACKSMSGSQAQNACCDRNAGANYASTAKALDGCLQQMWDEGLDTFTGEKGHYRTMKNAAYVHVSCAFTFAKNSMGANVVNMQQNFASSFNATKATVYNNALSKPSTGTVFNTLHGIVAAAWCAGIVMIILST